MSAPVRRSPAFGTAGSLPGLLPDQFWAAGGDKHSGGIPDSKRGNTRSPVSLDCRETEQRLDQGKTLTSWGYANTLAEPIAMIQKLIL